MMIESKKQQRMCKIHNARFYHLPPRMINSSAFNSELNLLAVAREDASIEIWNVSRAPYLERSIAGSVQGSIEAVAWAGDRLFSAGLTGELMEWDLQSLQLIRKILLTGNGAWCLDVNKDNTSIIVGTDNGYLNVFDLSIANEVNYVKMLDRQDGKVLCCKFDYSGTYVVTGSTDTIRVWEIKTGHAIYKMSVGRLEALKETIVWSLVVLRDFTIIAGDSRGYVTLWDGKLGAQIDSFAVMKLGDVLTVAVSQDERMFACAGIDPKIKLYALTDFRSGDRAVSKWVKFFQRSVHEHDVKTLQFVDQRVFSGGVDGYLGQSYSSKSKDCQCISKYAPFLQQPCSVVAPEKRILLLKYSNYIELWKLGTPSDSLYLTEEEDDPKKVFTLKEGLEKLLEFRAKHDAAIVCSTISPDGNFLVYSTVDAIRIFRNKYEEHKIVHLARLRGLPEQFAAATKVEFSSDSKYVYLVKRNQSVDIFEMIPTSGNKSSSAGGTAGSSGSSTGDVLYRETIVTDQLLKAPITHMLVSNCGGYLVCSGLCSTVAVWKRTKKGKYVHHLNLPKYSMPPVAMAMHKNSPKLVLAFADAKIFEYHLEEWRFLCTSSRQFVANQDTHVIRNIVLDPRDEDLFILHNETFLFTVKKIKMDNECAVPEKKAKENKFGTAETVDLVCKSKRNLEHLASICWMDKNELIAIGVNPMTLVEQLPSSLKEKRFGVS